MPAAFVKNTGQAHWHVLNRARAIENGCFIIAPCAVGPIPGGGESYGHSLIIDPWGGGGLVAVRVRAFFKPRINFLTAGGLGQKFQA